MKRYLCASGLLFFIIGCVVGIQVDSFGASVEEYKVARERLAKIEAAIKAKIREKNNLQRSIDEIWQPEVDTWKNKTGFRQVREGAKAEHDAALQKIEKIKQMMEDIDQEIEALNVSAKKQGKKVEESIPPPPWKNSDPIAFDNFQARRDQNYKNYQWWAAFGPGTPEEREKKARELYENVMKKIDRDEEAARAKKVKEKKVKEKQKPKKKVKKEQEKKKKVEKPEKKTADKKSQSSGVSSKPAAGPGKETHTEIWDLGKNPPETAFLTDAEVEMKKEIFKKHPEGYHLITTKDGKVIDVVANKDSNYLTGYITEGTGKDAVTTRYHYKKEYGKDAADAKFFKGHVLLEKKEYNPLDDPNLKTQDVKVNKKISGLVSKYQGQQPGSQKKSSGNVGGSEQSTTQPDSYIKGSIGKTRKPKKPKNSDVGGEKTQVPPPGKGGKSDKKKKTAVKNSCGDPKKYRCVLRNKSGKYYCPEGYVKVYWKHVMGKRYDRCARKKKSSTSVGKRKLSQGISNNCIVLEGKKCPAKYPYKKTCKPRGNVVAKCCCK